MNEYEEEVVFEIKMDLITDHIEEMFLDAMLSVLKKIKQRNSDFMKSENSDNNEPYPF